MYVYIYVYIYIYIHIYIERESSYPTLPRRGSAGRQRRDLLHGKVCERESSLLTTYWSESTLSSR